MSETTNLKLKKHDNPSTNEEQFDIENYLNGNWDKLEKNAVEVNTQISNINSKNTEQDASITVLQNKVTNQYSKILQLETEKTELETELKEMQEDFYQASVRGKASGEYIHVEDSSGARCKIGISGNSEQETRSGKNHYFIDDVETTTMSGVTYSIKKGLITLNGTATNTFTIKSSTKFSLSNEDYIMSATKIQGSFTGIIGKYVDKDSDIIIDGGLIGNTIKKKLTSDYTGLTTYLYIQKGAVCNNYQVKIQLEKGTEISEWEQAGLMPSPDYPSEIKTVGDNVNLFDKDFISSNYKYNNGLKLDRDELRTTTILLAEKIKSGNYTISFKYGGKSTSDNFGVQFMNGSKTILNLMFTTEKEKNVTINEEADRLYFYINNSQASGKVLYLDNIKLVKGTETGEYSSYGQGSVKVTKCNKNLVKETQNGYWNNSGVFDTDANYRSSKQIEVEKGKTYIASLFDKNKKYIGKMVYVLFDKDKKFTRYSGDDTITVANNEKYVSVRTYTSQANYVTSNNYLIQLEQSTKASSYEEHQEQSYIIPVQQPLKAIGNIRDTFIKRDGKWYERHYINRVILDGTEEWKLNSNSSAFRILNDDGLNETNVLSNYFPITTYENLYNKLNDYGVAISNGYIYIRNKDILSNSDFKSWITAKYNAGTPVEIYYVLQTPTDIECTEEQSKILDELNNARTYKNVTNITTDSKAVLDLDYVKDPETEHNKMQNEIDEIKQLLSTTQTSALLLDNLQKEVESEVE